MESPTAAATRLNPTYANRRDALAVERWIAWADSNQLTALQAVQPDSIREFERQTLFKIDARSPTGRRTGASGHDTYRIRTLIGRPLGVKYHGDGRLEKPKRPPQKLSDKKCPCGDAFTRSGQASCDRCRNSQRLRPSPEGKALRAAVNLHGRSLVGEALGLPPVEIWLRVCNRHPTAMSEAKVCRELVKVDRVRWSALRAEEFIYRAADVLEAV